MEHRNGPIQLADETEPWVSPAVNQQAQEEVLFGVMIKSGFFFTVDGLCLKLRGVPHNSSMPNHQS